MKTTLPFSAPNPRKTDPPTMTGYRLSDSGNVQVDSSVLQDMLSTPPPLPESSDPFDDDPDLVTEPSTETPALGWWARLKSFFSSPRPN